MKLTSATKISVGTPNVIVTETASAFVDDVDYETFWTKMYSCFARDDVDHAAIQYAACVCEIASAGPSEGRAIDEESAEP